MSELDCDSADPQDPERRIRELVQAARREGPQVWLELLRDREEWKLAPAWAQDEAIKAVTEKLGDQFTFQNTQIYECGGQRHRIAQFTQAATGAALNLLPGGVFEMGAACDREERPYRRVRLPAFLMGATPLTQAEWDLVGGYDRRTRNGAARPIEGIRWSDARDWLKKAGGGLRLPSEAEWEYACRAGTAFDFYFGDDVSNLQDYAWYRFNSQGESKPVRQLKPNAFGLYDMHGNVWECCEDRWHENYENAPSDGSAWTEGGDSDFRVSRGGAWSFSAEHCRSAARSKDRASSRNSSLGFRLCRSLA